MASCAASFSVPLDCMSQNTILPEDIYSFGVLMKLKHIKFTYIEFFDEMVPMFAKVFNETSQNHFSGPLNREALHVLEMNVTTNKSIK